MKIQMFERNQWVYWLFARFFPKSMKRKIVMIAAFCEVERKRGIKNQRVRKLNRALKLTETDSLLYGIRDLATPLSEQLFCEENSSVCDVASMCKSLAESIPEYLRYDDTETMVSDIAKVIVCNLK